MPELIQYHEAASDSLDAQPICGTLGLRMLEGGMRWMHGKSEEFVYAFMAERLCRRCWSAYEEDTEVMVGAFIPIN